MKKYLGFILIWFWCYFVSIFITSNLLSNRVLNYVVTIFLLVITYELIRRFIFHKGNGSDDENFLKEWEVQRKKGELNFIVLNGVILSIAVVIMIGTYIVTNKIAAESGDLLLALAVSLITGFLLTLTLWSANDQRYIKIKEK